MIRLVGGTYIATIKNKQWPVVLCSDEVAPPQFIALRRDPKHIPVIQLGRHRYIFVHQDTLQDFNPHKHYLGGLEPLAQKEVQPSDSEELKLEKQRRKAFSEDARLWHDHNFWANYITSQSGARKLEQENRNQQASAQKRRHLTSSGSVIDLQSGRISNDTTPVKRQKLHESRHSYQLLTPKRTPYKPPPTKRRHDFVNEVIELSDKNSSTDESEDGLFVSSAKDKGKKPAHTPRDFHQSIEVDDTFMSKSKSATPSPDQYMLIFPQGGVLIVEKNVIANCRFLLSRRSNDSTFTKLDLTHDKRAKEVKLCPDDVASVTTYYSHHEIGPRLTNKPNEPPFISRLDLSHKRKQSHVETLTKAFVTAVKIQDEQLQELIQTKLSTLSPLAPLSALILARSVANLPEASTEAQREVTVWATEQVAQCFWALARDCGEMLQSLLQEHKMMRVAVFEALKADPQGGKTGFDWRR